MKYAVFVYSMPLNDEDGVNDEWVMSGEALAELLAQEGVQKKPYVFDEQHLGFLEAGLTTWSKESEGTT